jgi:hypothetical protein
MSNKVKVWNDNVHVFTQRFKGEQVTIPAKGFIEMEWDEAISFKSHPFSMKFDGMGQQDPTSFKMIRVEGGPAATNQVIAFKSHKDGSIHATKSALEAYEAQFGDDSFADTEGAKIAASKRGRPSTKEATA